MKLVIAHSTTKRVLEGPFHLCGSRTDLAELARQIEVRLTDESWAFGWMTVYPVPRIQSNSAPVPWDE